MPNPETRLTNKIRKRLRIEYPDDVWWKIHGGPSQESGIPDLIGCHRGRFIALEVKVDLRSKASPKQRYQLERVTRALGYSAVVKSPMDALEVIRTIDSELDSLGDEPTSDEHED